MSTLTPSWSRWVVALSLVVAAGASIAAMNWYGTWDSFARLDAGSGGGVSLSTVESQANFQRWVLVALVSLVVAVATMARDRLVALKGELFKRSRLQATGR